ncbi:hypothetical protein D3C87_2013280 [compost metagenome]
MAKSLTKTVSVTSIQRHAAGRSKSSNAFLIIPTMSSLAKSSAERLTETATSAPQALQSRQAVRRTYSVSFPITPISSAMATNWAGGMYPAS